MEVDGIIRLRRNVNIRWAIIVKCLDGPWGALTNGWLCLYIRYHAVNIMQYEHQNHTKRFRPPLSRVVLLSYLESIEKWQIYNRRYQIN